MPQFLRKWVAMLETLLAKHRYMKWAFARSRDRDDLDTFLNGLTSSVGRMEAVLEDSGRCSFVPVMLAEAMSLRETVAIVTEADRPKAPHSRHHHQQAVSRQPLSGLPPRILPAEL